MIDPKSPNYPDKRATNWEQFRDQFITSNPIPAKEDEEDKYQYTRRKMEAIEDNLGRLAKFLDEAISRCRPFLVHDPRDASTAEALPSAVPLTSPHAQALDALNDKVWDLGTLVRNFLSNIDS